MSNPPFAKSDLEAYAAAYRANGFNNSKTCRELGFDRSAGQRRLRKCVEMNILSEECRQSENTARHDEYVSAKERKLYAYNKKKAKGDWRKPVVLRLPYKPFRLKLFGDPHLDDDGCNFELFEKHWLEMDAANGVYGMCVGDFFNNWLRVLAHKWKHEADPDDAWVCLEYLMEQRGDALLAACSGNHDDWTHGPTDPVDLLMKRYGVLYRKGAVRPLVTFPDGPEGASFTIGMRHKWRGASIYSAAHGIRRAVEKAWRDLISIGGHIHQDEPRMYTDPELGTHHHICQISAFKEFDEFADVQGFMGPKISPVWDLVIDPRLPDTDPDKVKIFWDSENAAKYLEVIS